MADDLYWVSPLINMLDGTPMTRYELRGALDRARVAAARAYPELAADIQQFQFRDYAPKPLPTRMSSKASRRRKNSSGTRLRR
jgi:hypothetical protein